MLTENILHSLLWLLQPLKGNWCPLKLPIYTKGVLVLCVCSPVEKVLSKCFDSLTALMGLFLQHVFSYV